MMSFPSRLKNSCDRTVMIRYRSPDGPPALPAFPFPGTRMRNPLPAPGGMRIVIFSWKATVPDPPQDLQLAPMRPAPLQTRQELEKRMNPCALPSCPEPLHFGQVCCPAALSMPDPS